MTQMTTHASPTAAAGLSRRGLLAASGAALAVAACGIRPKHHRMPLLGSTGSIEGSREFAKLGAAFVELSCRKTLVPDDSEDVFLQKTRHVKQLLVPTPAGNSFLPGRFQCIGDEADHAPVLPYADIMFARGEQLGMDTITFGSADARQIPTDFPEAHAEEQMAELLSALAPRAAEHGITVCLENLQSSECNFVNRVAQGARIVRAVDHPSVRLTADLFHMLREGEGPGGLADAADLVHHVHVAERRDRTAPGVDGDDFRLYLGALIDGGFDGRISIECRWRNLDDEMPVALRELRTQLRDVGVG